MTTTPHSEPSTERRDHPDLAPLYAVAGLADVVAETVRKAIAEQSERAARRGQELQSSARAGAGDVRTRLAGLPEQLRALPDTTRTRAAELQAQAEHLYAAVRTYYADLAERGRGVLDKTTPDTPPTTDLGPGTEDERAEATEAAREAVRRLDEQHDVPPVEPEDATGLADPTVVEAEPVEGDVEAPAPERPEDGQLR